MDEVLGARCFTFSNPQRTLKCYFFFISNVTILYYNYLLRFLNVMISFVHMEPEGLDT